MDSSDVKKAEKGIDSLNSKYEGAFQDKNGRWRAANGRFLTMQEQAEMAEKKISDIEGSGNRAAKGIDNIADSGDSAFKSIRNIVTGMGLVKVASAAFNVLRSNIDGAISRFDKLNQFPKVLTAMGASIESADAATQRLKDGIDGLPTTLQEVSDTTQQMYSVFKDADFAAKSTLALNDALLASGSAGEKAVRGTEQYMKILRTGKFDMDSFTTLQETMGFGLDKLAEKFGFTGKSAQNDLYKALQEGRITVDQFNQGLIDIQDGLGGTSEVARSTTEGIGTSFTNLRNSVTNNLANMLKKIDEITTKLTGNSIAGNMNNLKGVINSTMGSITDSFDLILPYAEKIPTLFQTIGDGVMNSGFVLNLQQSFSFVQESASNLVQAVSERLPGIIDSFNDVWTGIQPALTQIGGFISSWTTTIGKLLEVTIPIAIDVLKIAFDGISSFVLPIFEELASTAWDVAGALTESIMNNVVPALEKFGDWINENKSVVEVLSGVVIAAAGSFLTFKIYLTAMSIISTVTKLIGGLTIAFTTLSNLGIGGTIKMLAGIISPVSWVVIAIGAVIGLVTYLWKTNEGFRNAVISIWEKIKGAFIGAKEAIEKAWSDISSFFSNLFDSIKQTFDDAVLWMQEAPGRAADWIQDKWNGIKTYFSDMWQGIKNTTSEVWDSIVGFFSPIVSSILAPFEPIKTYFSGLWEQIGIIASAGWEVIKSIIMAPVLFLIDAITMDFDQLKEDMMLIWTNISTNAMLVFNTVKDIIVGAFTAVVETGSNLFTIFSEFLSSIWLSITTFATETWTSFLEWWDNLVQTTTTNVQTWFSNLVEGTKQFFTDIVTWGQQTWTNFLSWLDNFIYTTVENIKSWWSNLVTSVKQFFSDIVEGGRQSWQDLVTSVSETIESIKEWFGKLAEIDLLDIGRAIIDGLVDGLTDAWEKGKEFVGGIGDWIREHKGPIEYDRVMLTPAGEAIMGSLHDGLQAQYGQVQATILSMNDLIVSTFTQIQANVSNFNLAPQGLTIGQSLAGGFASGLASLPNSMNQAMSATVASLAASGSNMIAIGRQIGNQLTDAVLSGIQSKNKAASVAGSTLILSLAVGMSGNSSRVIALIVALINQVIQTLSSNRGKMSRVGLLLIVALVQGLSSGRYQVQNQTKTIGDLIYKVINDNQSRMRNAGQDLMSRLAEGIRNGTAQVSNAMRSVSGAMLNAISKGINGSIGGVNFVLGELGSTKKIGSWSIPAYAKGTKGHPKDGPALVNDAKSSNFQEAYIDPKGNMGMFPKVRNVVANLKKGTQVIRGSQVAKMKKFMPAYAKGTMDFDIFDYFDRPKEMVDKAISMKTDLSGIVEPWMNMTKSAVSMITDAALPLIEQELANFAPSGSGSFTPHFPNPPWVRTSGFGPRWGTNHNGIDFGAPLGTPIPNQYPGKVVAAGPASGFGNWVGVQVASNMVAIYGHMRSVLTRVGEYVKSGQVIARNGSEGQSTGPHVHYELREGGLNGRAVDPDSYGSEVSTPFAGGSGVDRWRGIVMRALQMTGQYSASNVDRTLMQMQSESGGNPRAINLWDSNAKAGIPSKGLMQVIDPTFRAHALSPFNKDIYDPMSNVLASIRYAVSRYGSLARAYRGTGYENGGLITKEHLAMVGEGNKPELVVPLTKKARALELLAQGFTYIMGPTAKASSVELPKISQRSLLGMDRQYSTTSQAVYNTYNNSHTAASPNPDYIVLENTIELDGRQVGKGTALYVKQENDRQNKIYQKIRGV